MSSRGKRVQSFNREYLQYVKNRPTTRHKNYLKKNIALVKELSKTNQSGTSQQVQDGSDIHASKCQAYKSVALNVESLRDVIAKYPSSFSLDYLRIIEPRSAQEVARSIKEEEKRRWMSKSGFIYPGVRTARESVKPDISIDSARREDLSKPWQETIIHFSQSYPPVVRDRLPLDKDFNYWSLNSNECFGQEPLSIYLAGDTHRREQLDSAMRDEEVWKSKLVVDNPKMTFLTDQDNDQLNLLQGLLKDRPKKYSLRKSSMQWKDVRPFSVLTETCDRKYEPKRFTSRHKPSGKSLPDNVPLKDKLRQGQEEKCFLATKLV